VRLDAGGSAVRPFVLSNRAKHLLLVHEITEDVDSRVVGIPTQQRTRGDLPTLSRGQLRPFIYSKQCTSFSATYPPAESSRTGVSNGHEDPLSAPYPFTGEAESFQGPDAHIEDCMAFTKDSHSVP